MLKQTKEFFVFIGALVAGTVASFADRKFGFDDIRNYFQAFLSGQDGIDGIGEIPRELIEAAPEQKREAFLELEQKLISGGMDPNDAYDTATLLSGAGSGVALGSRLTSREKNDQFAKMIESGAVTVNVPMTVGENGWTGEQVGTLLATYEDLL